MISIDPMFLALLLIGFLLGVTGGFWWLVFQIYEFCCKHFGWAK